MVHLKTDPREHNICILIDDNQKDLSEIHRDHFKRPQKRQA